MFRSQISLVNYRGSLNVIGMTEPNSLAILISYLGSDGWSAGQVLNPFYANPIMQLCVASHDSDIEVIALMQDGTVELAAYGTNDGWQNGTTLPLGTQSPIRSISSANSDSGDLQVFGIDGTSTPYLVSYLSDGGWQAGMALPLPVSGLQFQSMTTATRDNDLEVFGLAIDGTPYLISYLGNDGWQAGMALPLVASGLGFQTLNAVGSDDGDLQVLGLAIDGTPYLISYLGNDGWQAGMALPLPASGLQFQIMTTAMSRSNTLEVLGLTTDGTPYLICYLDNDGWQAGMALPLPASGLQFDIMAMAVSHDKDIEVFGIASDGTPYLVSYLGNDGWQAGMALPLPSPGLQFQTLYPAVSDNGDLQVLGLTTDGVLYLVSYLGGDGWQSGMALPYPTYANDTPSMANVVLTDAVSAFNTITPKNGNQQSPFGLTNAAISHIQGFTNYNGIYLMSHNEISSGSGYFYIGDPSIGNLTTAPSLSPNDYRHPGGIQGVGDFLVVGVEKSDSGNVDGYIQFYWIKNMPDGNPVLIDYATFLRQGGAASIGMANYRGSYILCVYAAGTIEVYRSNATNFFAETVSFSSIFSFSPKDENGSDSGYDNMSLVVDEKNVYIVGMRSETGGVVFQDYADLIKLDIDNEIATTLSTVHFDTDAGSIFGPHFRYGAGATTSPDNGLTLTCTARDIQQLTNQFCTFS